MFVVKLAQNIGHATDLDLHAPGVELANNLAQVYAAEILMAGENFIGSSAWDESARWRRDGRRAGREVNLWCPYATRATDA